MKLWNHLLRLLWFGVTLFAAGSGVMPDLAGDTGGDSGGAGASGGDGSAGAGQPSSSAGGQPAGGDQGGIKQLREAYEAVKAKYEPWDKLGTTPDAVGNWRGTYDKLYTQAASIGRNLGYSDTEIAECLVLDPVKTLDFLRDEVARAQQGRGGQAGQGQDLADLVAQHVEQAIGPIQQRENIRATNEANSLFERTVHGLTVQAFKSEGIDAAQIPEDEMFMLTSAVSEILKYDENALKELKYEGKTGAIQKAFQEARTYLDKYYVARSGRERNRMQPVRGANGQFQQPQNGNGRKPSLDEMINEPGLINAKYGQ